jgi:arginine decarboxylase
MQRPVVGWESEAPVPNQHIFNSFLSARNGRLFLEDLDLAQLVMGGGSNQGLSENDQGLGEHLPSPLEIVYLPLIRTKIEQMQAVFAKALAQTGYAGRFHYAYTSKANVAEEVVRTAVRTGVNYEITSAIDIAIVRLLMAGGHLSPNVRVICNGFKQEGSTYSKEIVQLQRERGKVLPVLEDREELPPLVKSGLTFEVGVRHKTYGHHHTGAEMEANNSRFGLTNEELWALAEEIEAAPNLELKLYHAMVGSQNTDVADFLERLTPPMHTYAQLRQKFPSLSIFDFGGGMPAPMTLDFNFDYAAFAEGLLTRLQEVCGQYNVPVPDVLGEFGRYTVTEHGAHLFKVAVVKENGSKYPWYIINGSIMSSMPDSWALGEHFIVLPLNNLDKPFRQVQLGGITCDSDDVYPPKSSSTPLYLPVDTEDLHLGFFSIGAYQEMLGGAGGSKHCLLPEATELLIERDSEGRYDFQVIPGQNSDRVLKNLGYIPP